MEIFVSDGATINSTFDLYFGHEYKPLTDEKMALFRSELEELKFLIVDEMSMVSSDYMYKMHHRLTDIFQNDQPFGGIGIMFVGDLLQLRPVKGSFIFQSPRNSAYSSHFEDSSLWHNLEAISLKHNHRQGENSYWTQALNRLRIGELTGDDIDLLRSRLITKLSKNYPYEACHLFYTNREVNDHNDKMISKLDGKLYEIELVGDYPKSYKPRISNFGTVDDTSLMQTLRVKIGARVMVVLNISISDSLVNGSLGTVIDIMNKDDGKVSCIVIKFDIEKAGIEQRKNYSKIADKYKDSNGTPVFRHRVRYFLTTSKGKPHARQATVFQFPIKVAYAITGHKMQVTFLLLSA